MRKGRRIKTLHQLAKAADERRAVLTGKYTMRRYPAAVIMQRQGPCILRMLNEGIYLYNGTRRVDLTKPPRKWIPHRYRPTDQNKPILNLPYYP